MVAAARKKYGMERDIEAQYNEDLGEVELFEFRTVVEELGAETADQEITLDLARKADPECEIGDSLGIKITVDDLGRIAAQTAKQVIIQKIRDAEREMTFNEFKDRKGELITGIVRRFEKGNFVVDLGKADAILPKREQVPTETYRQGDRIQAYVLDITRASKSPQVVLSRTHPGLLMKLFELEVPEIYEGIVRIEACAREPGHRAKIAVSSLDRDVDPVGACASASRAPACKRSCRSSAAKRSTSFPTTRIRRGSSCTRLRPPRSLACTWTSTRTRWSSSFPTISCRRRSGAAARTCGSPRSSLAGGSTSSPRRATPR